MTLDTEKLTLLLSAIANFKDVLGDRFDGKLDIDAIAADSAKLEGKTLAEIQVEIGGDIESALSVLEADFNAFIARRDNPHQVTKAQVELGDVENFGVATNEEAITGSAIDKYLTPANLGAFWADKVGTAPETLDTIHEIAAALQNNPDVIQALQTIASDNAAAIDALETTSGAHALAIQANTDAIDDLVVQLTTAFNDAAQDLAPYEPN